MVVNKRVTHLKHRKITVSPAASHSGGVFPPLSYYYPPSPLLYTSDTVRLNFTSCHSARMASLPSHPLTLTCTNTQTHKLAARGGAKRWRCSGPVMTRPSCKHLALCVCTCVCVRHLMPTPLRHTHTVRNTDAFMDSFAHTHTTRVRAQTHSHSFFPWYKRE